MKTPFVFTIQRADGLRLNSFMAEWTQRDDAIQEAKYMAEAYGVATYVFSPYGLRIASFPAPTLRPIGAADRNMFIDGGR